MPRKPNVIIGECPCPIEGCSKTGAVRRVKNHERGALYVTCPDCGAVPTPNAHAIRATALQEWIAGNMTNMTEPAPETPPAPREHAPAKPAPEKDTDWLF